MKRSAEVHQWRDWTDRWERNLCDSAWMHVFVCGTLHLKSTKWTKTAWGFLDCLENLYSSYQELILSEDRLSPDTHKYTHTDRRVPRALCSHDAIAAGHCFPSWENKWPKVERFRVKLGHMGCSVENRAVCYFGACLCSLQHIFERWKFPFPQQYLQIFFQRLVSPDLKFVLVEWTFMYQSRSKRKYFKDGTH